MVCIRRLKTTIRDSRLCVVGEWQTARPGKASFTQWKYADKLDARSALHPSDLLNFISHRKRFVSGNLFYMVI